MILVGKIISGAGRGRGLGFPTLNLNISDLDIKHGVYAVKADGNLAVMNWGPQPTFDSDKPVIEVHLLDFEGDFEGAELQVEILEFIREVRHFENAEALHEQIAKDIVSARHAYERLS
ncbi:hypothetical protein HOC00_04075 [Candidatus Peregrinibacteria bacterium]|nr:hypothetical protein [Candidatus Peregrinibacteria bacterium]